jgi:hypothetical protein
MGFDVNFNSKPIIKETQSMHDGGAGNLGYFEKEEEKNQKDKDKSIFNEAKNKDTFEKQDDIDYEYEFSISKFIAKIIFAIKDWLKKSKIIK